LLGNGEGSFSSAYTNTAGTDPQILVAAPLNPDSSTDYLIVGDGSSSKFATYTVNGNGSLAKVYNGTVTTHTPFSALAVGSIVPGGDPDIVVGGLSRYVDGAGTVNDEFAVYSGNGNGTVQTSSAPARYFEGYGNVYSLAVADVNGDGYPDVLTLSAAYLPYGSVHGGVDGLNVILGNGNGTFQTQQEVGTGIYQEAAAVGSFYESGGIDLALAGDDGVNNGPYDSRVGETVIPVNGDGVLGSTRVFSAAYGPLSPEAVAVGHFGGSSYDGIVQAGNSTTVRLSNGSGGFTYATGKYSQTDLDNVDCQKMSPGGIGIGEFVNTDGYDDIVIPHNSGYGYPIDFPYSTPSYAAGVDVILSNGNGTFLAPQRYNIGYCVATAVGKFNGDGDEDIAVANDTTDSIGVLFGNGNGTFIPYSTSNAVSLANYGEPVSMIVGNFINNNPWPDLIVGVQSSFDEGGSLPGKLVLLRGDGDGFDDPTLISGSAGVNPFCLADGYFGGDGNLDIATAVFQDKSVDILSGDGDGDFSSLQEVGSLSFEPRSIVVADFNGEPGIAACGGGYGGGDQAAILLTTTGPSLGRRRSL
jgi:hypothetical protein